jgi:hypothetical protein
MKAVGLLMVKRNHPRRKAIPVTKRLGRRKWERTSPNTRKENAWKNTSHS